MQTDLQSLNGNADTLSGGDITESLVNTIGDKLHIKTMATLLNIKT